MRISTETMIRLAIAGALVLAVGAFQPVSAQTPQEQQQPPAQEQRGQEAAPLEGELVAVDTDAKTITIKTADGADVQVLYTDTTEVSGAQEGVAGLATTQGGRVTIHFTEDDASVKTATRIIVEP